MSLLSQSFSVVRCNMTTSASLILNNEYLFPKTSSLNPTIFSNQLCIAKLLLDLTNWKRKCPCTQHITIFKKVT